MARFFQGFRRDAHPMAVMVASVGALSAFYHDFDRHLRSDAAHGRIDADDRENADARRHGVQIFDRPAVHLSEERSRLHLEFPAHVLRRAVRGIQGQSGAVARARPHLHPACRSRAERFDFDGAARRLVGRQSVRLYRGGRRLPLGAGAWRRQRSGAQNAVGDRHGRKTFRNSSRAPRTRTIRSV